MTTRCVVECHWSTFPLAMTPIVVLILSNVPVAEREFLWNSTGREQSRREPECAGEGAARSDFYVNPSFSRAKRASSAFT
jgi:hypothetical protein